MPYVRWLWSDPETMEPVGGPVAMTDDQARRWFEAMIDPGNPADCYRLIFDGTGRPVGEISFHRLDRPSMTADFNIKVAARERGKGYARQAMELFFDYFFKEFGGQTLVDDVAFSNEAGQQTLKDFGFEHDPAVEGVYRLRMTRDRYHTLHNSERPKR